MLIHIVHQLPLLACAVSVLDDTEAVQSAHRLRQEALAEKWEELRDKLFKIGTSTPSMPPKAVCYVCQKMPPSGVMIVLLTHSIVNHVGWVCMGTSISIIILNAGL